MHDAERRQENPETEPVTEMQKRHHQHEIGDGFDDEEKEVECLHHETSAPARSAPCWRGDRDSGSFGQSSETVKHGGVLQILQAIPFTAIL